MQEFLAKTGFSERDSEIIIACYEKMKKTENFEEKIGRAMDEFLLATESSYCEMLDAVAKEAGIAYQTACLIFLIMAAKPLKYMYRAKGISDEVYDCSMHDLAVKNEECKKAYGVVGTFAHEWLRRYFKMTLFGLGRLQFEWVIFDRDYKNFIKKGDRVLNCHIPSGRPLKQEEVMASLQNAYAFFGISGPMAVRCQSWLLDPETAQLYKEGSNLRAFYEMFAILERFDTGKGAISSVFGKLDFEDVTEDDVKTSFQKSYYDYIKSGGKLGNALGIFMYEPDKGAYKE